MAKLQLTENFETRSQEDWLALVEAGLKGKAFDSLVHETADSLARGPLFTKADTPDAIAPTAQGEAPLLEGRPWHITANLQDTKISDANTTLLTALKGGASAARLTLGEAGLNITKKADLKRLFEGIYTDLIPIIIAPHNYAAIAKLLEDYHAAHIYLGLAPKTNELKDIAAALPEKWRAVTINAARVHETGGTEAQELAYFAASCAHTYHELGPQLAAKHICAELSADQDGHLTIAKLRAARRIYARIAESFGQENTALNLHVVTSKRMMQSLDPWTNMLRVMSASFGAIIGGADFITARPFTDTIGTPTDFAERIARNMQLLMMEESHLGHVKDAAYGSYFHEAMTDKLAKAAWAEFQMIEAEGGLLNIDPFKARVQAAKEKREEAGEPILGVTLHPPAENNTRNAKVKKVFS